MHPTLATSNLFIARNKKDKTAKEELRVRFHSSVWRSDVNVQLTRMCDLGDDAEEDKEEANDGAKKNVKNERKK